jgi:TolB protein
MLAACGPGLVPADTPAATPGELSGPVIVATVITSPVEPVASPPATAAPSPTPRPSATALPTPTPEPTPRPGTNLIAFETTREGKGEIYVLDAVTGQMTNVSSHPAEDGAPAWSPDGSAVAFASRRDGNWEIYVLDLDDGSLARLTENPAYDGAPAWSPDGSRLAFESYRDGNLEIYVVGAQGGEARRLTDDAAGDFGPAWSPDGDTVAFTSWRDGNKEIYVVPAAGGEARNLSWHPADDESPAWGGMTADGMSLAFVSWRDVDPQTGNRNAEIYIMGADGGEALRLTDNPWPDLDPAWDAAGRLIWSAYDAGPPFEAYDPYRPGSYHLYRAGENGPERLGAGRPGDGDDRHPSPAPGSVSGVGLAGAGVAGGKPSPVITLEPGTLARVVPVPSVVTTYDQAPVLASELVSPSLLAWQRDVLEASGHDLLRGTLGTWRPIDSVRQRELYAYDYGYLSWHKTGRALDLALEYKVDGVDQMLVVRDDLGPSVYWRMFLRTARQDGSQGAPLKENPWLFWWHIVPTLEPEAYAAGGKRLPIPPGYYVDVTAIARRHGWERIASYAIEGDYHWLVDSNGTEYWHYERTDGLLWWDAMLQIYPLDVLLQHAAWEIGQQKAQSEAMMRSKGVPTPVP